MRACRQFDGAQGVDVLREVEVWILQQGWDLEVGIAQSLQDRFRVRQMTDAAAGENPDHVEDPAGVVELV